MRGDSFVTDGKLYSVPSMDIDLSDSDDEDEDFEDCRASFASAMTGFRHSSADILEDALAGPVDMADYDVWMVDPGSITERRLRLLQVMGLRSNKDLHKLSSIEHSENSDSSFSAHILAQRSRRHLGHDDEYPVLVKLLSHSPSPSSASSSPGMLARSRSDAEVRDLSCQRRGQELLGSATSSPYLLHRVMSAPVLLFSNLRKPLAFMSGFSSGASHCRPNRGLLSAQSEAPFFCKIKNLDTGKEFIVNEDGTWNCLGEVETGWQRSLEEFERCIGYSPIVKELMRRENVGASTVEKLQHPLPPKSLKSSTTKKRAGWLKNIKGVANTVSVLMSERDFASATTEKSTTNSKWVKVHQHGKSYKELSGLYMCQAIQAHQGSIWTIKFSLDARYLASAGEDRVIHVWQALDHVAMLSLADETFHDSSRSLGNQSLRGPSLGECRLSKRRSKVSSSRRKSPIPDYVIVPDTTVSFSEKPFCSFHGHLDDILDLSWSTSQLLLSSSMDKTVRLWDLESKACLKLFAHNDYVTCIHFNPIDDKYFISGSLDAKVRIWSIPERQVIDWSDLHEMVTAACYTPDGQGALVGSHKGSCRFYDTSGHKLYQKEQLELRNKRKRSQAKKITGFQFAPGSSSQVLITSADSQIRLYDCTALIRKFRGFRNRSSQIAASFTVDGKYVVSASEDSQVLVWRCDDLQSPGSGCGSINNDGSSSIVGKSKEHITTRAYEYFHCRDVSIAIPWPGIRPGLPSVVGLSQRQNPVQQSGPLNLAGDNVAADSSMRGQLPPLPRRSPSELIDDTEDEHSLEVSSRSVNSCAMSCRFTPSRSSGLPLLSYLPTRSSSSSSSSSFSWFNTNSTSSATMQFPTAWGLAVVTAGFDGEIRVYQNFGLPVRL